MIRLFFVGDGPRDSATLPAVVRGILEKDVLPEFQQWKELRLGGKGNDRKLKYAVRHAMHANLEGVVAVVDRDRDRERLQTLAAARAEDRQTGVSFPTAIGCAAPHVEKWLVSDRTALQGCFPKGSSAEFAALQASRKPKDDLNTMFRDHGIQYMDGLALCSRTSSKSPDAREGRTAA